MSEDYTLEELASLSGLSLRTVRFYIQQGLLPGPDTRGKNARYTKEHLERLELIQHFKNLYLPLQEIRRVMENMTPTEVNFLLHSQDPIVSCEPIIDNLGNTLAAPPSGQSALDYIQNLEEAQSKIQSVSTGWKSQPANPQATRQPSPLSPSRLSASPANDLSETWQRIVIKEGVELHLREPVTPEDQKEIERIVDSLRRFFGNQQ
jgi:DNA-binding transcriptional MerR regulator